MRLCDVDQSTDLIQAKQYERERFATEQELEPVRNQNPAMLGSH